MSGLGPLPWGIDVMMRGGGIGQVVVVGIVCAIIAVFVLEFRAAGGQQTGSLTRPCIVEVSGECLDPKDYTASFGLIVPPGVPAKQVKALNLKDKIIEGLVERELLVLQAKKIGVSTSLDALDNELAEGRTYVSLPAAESLMLGYRLQLLDGGPTGLTGDLVRELPVNDPKTGQFDPEQYKRVVRSTARRSPKEFKNIQEREFVAARMRALVRSRVRLPEDEAFEAFSREKSRAVVRTVRLDTDWFGRYAVDTSDAAADAYAKEHAEEVDKAWDSQKDHYKADCILAEEIFVAVPQGSTEEDRAPLRDKIDEAEKRVRGGEPFGAVARELSEGPAAIIGGQLGCLSKEAYGEGAEVLLDAVSKLDKGAVSPVLETTRGLHLVRRHGKLTEDPVAHGKRMVARGLAAQTEARKKAEEFGKALIAAAKSGEKLEDAVRTLTEQYAGDWAKADKKASKKPGEGEEEDPVALRDARRPKVDISAPFGAGGNPLPGAFPGVSPAQIAFSLSAPDDVHPEPIPLMDGFAVLQLKEKEAATREEFEKDKQEIIQQLRLAKQNDAVVQYVAALRDKYKDEVKTNPGLIRDGAAPDDGE